MGKKAGNSPKMVAYEKKILEDLSVNDALILIAVCAAEEKADAEHDQAADARRISALARNHPIFSGLEDSIVPAINKFMNMIGATGDRVTPVESAASTLDSAEKTFRQKFKQTAFAWAAEMMATDRVQSEIGGEILDKYARLLDIDPASARHILA